MENKTYSAGPLDRDVRGDSPRHRDWLQEFESYRGLGGILCEAQHIEAACAEIGRLRGSVAAFRKMVFTNGDCKMTMDGRVFTAHEGGFISDNNFDFDAGMQVSGDFVENEKQQYAEMIVAALNAPNTIVRGGSVSDTSQ